MNDLWNQVILMLLFSVSGTVLILIVVTAIENKKETIGERIFYNTKRIKQARKKLEKLERKRKPNQYRFDMAKKELETELLFEKCTVFGDLRYEQIYQKPNACIMFSDDNKVMRFIDVVIPYHNIKAYDMVPNNVQKSVTHTKKKGVVGRAIVGDVIAGPVGAVIGAATARSKSNTTYYTSQEGFTFQIETKDGHIYSYHVAGSGFLSNKIYAAWNDMFYKLDKIMADNA